MAQLANPNNAPAYAYLDQLPDKFSMVMLNTLCDDLGITPHVALDQLTQSAEDWGLLGARLANRVAAARRLMAWVGK